MYKHQGSTLKQSASARRHYRSTRVTPSPTSAWSLYQQQGAPLKRSESIRPGYRQPRRCLRDTFELGLIYGQQGSIDEAIPEFQIPLR